MSNTWEVVARKNQNSLLCMTDGLQRIIPYLYVIFILHWHHSTKISFKQTELKKMTSEFFTILDYKDSFAGKTVYAERSSIFRHLLTKPREHILLVVKHYGILNNPQVENYYRVLNILIEACKNPGGRQMWDRFYK